MCTPWGNREGEQGKATLSTIRYLELADLDSLQWPYYYRYYHIKYAKKQFYKTLNQCLPTQGTIENMPPDDGIK